MSINAASSEPPSERSTILHTIAGNSDALGELGTMLHDIETRLYRPHPIGTEKSVADMDETMDETMESMIERQSYAIQQHNETALRIMNRLA